ncbi:MAG TPA: hypothetical protein VD840_14765 [Sinorhizobium sp.]|nr:hypothetical protein [Sinorhizobium sp.]
MDEGRKKGIALSEMTAPQPQGHSCLAKRIVQRYLAIGARECLLANNVFRERSGFGFRLGSWPAAQGKYPSTSMREPVGDDDGDPQKWR